LRTVPCGPCDLERGTLCRNKLCALAKGVAGDDLSRKPFGHRTGDLESWTFDGEVEVTNWEAAEHIADRSAGKEDVHIRFRGCPLDLGDDTVLCRR
jgi:hypothetical protein